jgi:uncharacterized protein (DUF1501 family)
MKEFWELYNEGFVGVAQGVGYPDSPRSHPDAMRNWHTGLPNVPNSQRGWLGAASDEQLADPGYLNSGVFVGDIELPFILNSREAIVPSLKRSGQLVYSKSTQFGSETDGELSRVWSSYDCSLLEFARQLTESSWEFSRRIEDATKSNSSSTAYPPIELAQNLRTVAQLIRAEVGFRIFVTELGGPSPGGFDNHANQRGNHAALLRQLSESIAAFMADLKKARLLDRVILMTYSEFGRTLAENGRRGTGHGAAAPVFLVGGRIKGGLVGAHPSLSDLDDGALRFSTDFRSLYATLLEDWLGIDSDPVLGRGIDRLDLVERI